MDAFKVYQGNSPSYFIVMNLFDTNNNKGKRVVRLSDKIK
jgi:hypothetical protein